MGAIDALSIDSDVSYCHEHCHCESCSNNEFVIRAKWIMDDAKTLEEAAIMVEEFAEWLRNAHKKGWRLLGEVSDDYGFMRKLA